QILAAPIPRLSQQANLSSGREVIGMAALYLLICSPRPSHPQGLNPEIGLLMERDLLTHKEVELLLSGFFREMFLKRPGNIQEFAADYFTDPRLPNKIHMQLIKEKKAA
uniref:Regulatory subunit of type II PKA R-subunit domain containing 1 n=1 Tax=Ursus maritimus TaxID=29073 RepID=A0A452T2C4_URSMA